MNKKQRKAYDAVFHKPTLADICWKDVEKLFIHLGAEIIPGKGSRVSIFLNGEVAVFHRSHPQKEAVKGGVVAVREFLKLAGVESC
jgi:hypothetical protein